MAIEKVREYLKQWNKDKDIKEYDVSTATVDLAAQAEGVIPARIAKTLTFYDKEGCIMVVTAGDTKIDNSKFKGQFGMKAKMLSAEDVPALTGFQIGGVCPLGVENPVAKIYCDISIKRFDTVFPACGSSNSSIELTTEELFEYSKALGWVDVCKGC